MLGKDDCSWACRACIPCTRATVNLIKFSKTQVPVNSNSNHGNLEHKISLIAHRCVCEGKRFPVP
jgi:hypothetical protein